MGLAQHAAPFVEPLVLVPVEIIDQRIGRGPAGLFGSFDRGARAREDRIDLGIVDAGEIFDVVTIIPLPFRIDRKRCFTGTSPDKRYPSKLEMMVVSSFMSAKVTSAPYG